MPKAGLLAFFLAEICFSGVGSAQIVMGRCIFECVINNTLPGNFMGLRKASGRYGAKNTVLLLYTRG